MKKILFILLMITTSIFAQKKINNYKYVIVPNKFDFLKKNDQFQTSSLTKFLFNKYGFIALLSDEEFPKDLANDKCLALKGIVKKRSSMLTIKTVVELRDCFNRIVFSSNIGRSMKKEYKKGYHEAIRNSFKTIQNLKYNYIPAKNEIAVKENITIINEPKVDKNTVITPNLYAQSITNGFQLVNTKPEVVFEIIKTSVKDVFIIKNKNGIIYKNKDLWIAEYYKEDLKIIEEYYIKF